MSNTRIEYLGRNFQYGVTEVAAATYDVLPSDDRNTVVTEEVGGTVFTLPNGLPEGFEIRILSLVDDSTLEGDVGIVINGVGSPSLTIPSGYTGLLVIHLGNDEYSAT